MGAFITRLRTDKARRFIARFIAFESNLAADLDKEDTEGEKQATRTSRDKKGIPPKIIAMNKQSMECEIPVSQNISLYRPAINLAIGGIRVIAMFPTPEAVKETQVYTQIGKEEVPLRKQTPNSSTASQTAKSRCN
jgi:hypothetical protein